MSDPISNKNENVEHAEESKEIDCCVDENSSNKNQKANDESEKCNEAPASCEPHCEVAAEEPCSQSSSTYEDMQQYLYDEILQKNYDSEQFRAYLQQKFPGAEEDLNLVGMEQLKKITVEFQEQQNAILASSSHNSSTISHSNTTSSVSKIQPAGTTSTVHRSSVFTGFISSKQRQNSYALNPPKRITPLEPPKQGQATSNQNEQSCEGSSTDQNASLSGESILQSTFSNSKVLKDTTGATIVRKEVQIVPETSVVRDAFIKKNMEGEECSKVISCREVENSKLADFWLINSDAIVKAIIEKYSVVYDGVFSSEYALYEVRTPALEWTVNRRFSDFEWLYSALRKHYPGQFVPPIAKKTAIKELGDQHLYERMRSFEQFLNQIMLSPVLRLSTHVSEFLSIADQKTFEAKRKEFDAKQSPNIVDEITTLDGSLVSEITPPLKEFWTQFADQNDKSLLNYEGLTAQFDIFTKSLRVASESSNKIALHYSRMYKVHEQYNRISPLGKVPILEKLAVNFNNFFVELSTSLTQITVALEKNIGEYVRYHRQMLEEFKVATQTRMNLQSKYLDRLRKLNEKKEKLFVSGTTAKWEVPPTCTLTIRELQANKIEAFKIMLPTETNHVTAEGEFFGYVNKSLYQDVTMHLQHQVQTSSKRFIDLSSDLALEINKLHIQIAESNMQFSDLLGMNHSSLNHRYNDN